MVTVGQPKAGFLLVGHHVQTGRNAIHLKAGAMVRVRMIPVSIGPAEYIEFGCIAFTRSDGLPGVAVHGRRHMKFVPMDKSIRVQQ